MANESAGAVKPGAEVALPEYRCWYRQAGFTNCPCARFDDGSCVPDWAYPQFAAWRDAEPGQRNFSDRSRYRLAALPEGARVVTAEQWEWMQKQIAMIAGAVPWDDPDQGYVDKAHAISAAMRRIAGDE